MEGDTIRINGKLIKFLLFHKRIHIVLIIIISVFISIITLNWVTEIFNIFPVKYKMLEEDIIFYGNIIDDGSLRCIVRNSQDILQIQFIDSTGFHIKHTLTDFEVSKIHQQHFILKDYDYDSINELIFTYLNNDSLYIISVSFELNSLTLEPRNYFIDEYDGEFGKYKKSIVASNIALSNFDEDSDKEIIISYYGQYTGPRAVAVLDLVEDKIIRRNYYAGCPEMHIADDKIIVMLRASANGNIYNGENDYNPVVIIMNHQFDVLWQKVFARGYTSVGILFNEIDSTFSLMPYSYWNREKFPTYIETFNLMSNNPSDSVCVNDLSIQPGIYISDNVRMPFFVGIDKNSNIRAFDMNGKLLHELAYSQETPLRTERALTLLFYIPENGYVYGIRRNDSTYIFDWYGKVLCAIPTDLNIMTKDKHLYDLDDPQSAYYNSIVFSKEGNYSIKIMTICISTFMIFFIILFMLIHFIYYLISIKIMSMIMVSGVTPMIIQSGQGVLISNEAAKELLRKNSEINDIIIKPNIGHTTIDNYYITKFNIKWFRTTLIGTIIQDISLEIENKEYKAIFDEITIMAHNIKNVFGSISLRAQKLQNTEHDENSEYLINRINELSEDVNDMTRNMLSIAIGRIETTRVIINEYFKNLLKAYPDYIIYRNESGVTTFETDTRLLRFVIKNIIENAVDAVSGRDDKIISITIKNENGLTIEIFNNGPIMSNDEIEKALSGGYSTKKKGSGYGIFISDRLLRRLNYTFDIMQNEEGMLFRISIPAKDRII